MLNEELFNAIADLIIGKNSTLKVLSQTNLHIEYIYQHYNIQFQYKPVDTFGPNIAMTRRIDIEETKTIIIYLIDGKTDNSKEASKALFDIYNLLTTT